MSASGSHIAEHVYCPVKQSDRSGTGVSASGNHAVKDVYCQVEESEADVRQVCLLQLVQVSHTAEEVWCSLKQV